MLVLALAAPADAHVRTVLDPDDSPGPLDIVAARLRDPREEFLKLRIVTYEEWESVQPTGPLDFFSLELDDPARPGVDRCVVMRTRDAGDGFVTMEAVVYSGCEPPFPYDHVHGYSPGGTRPDSHSTTILVDPEVLWKKPPPVFRWRAVTSYEDPDYPGCEPPDPPPPEHFSGTCTDVTEWDTHRVRH